MRNIVTASVLSVIFSGCGTVPISSEELSGAVTADRDLDDNGVSDVEQSFVVGTDPDGNTVVLVDPGQKSPYGTASGQTPEFRGYGSGMYSSGESGWASGFFPAVAATNSETGELIGYGNAGFRPGAYEVVMAEIGARIGVLDGWWDLSIGLAPGDERDYLVTVSDGTTDCPRESVHLAFEVWDDGVVTPLGYSIAPRDETCY